MLNSTIAERIYRVEEQWLDLLVAHITKLFSDTFLPSHDQDHHRRVWNIGKTLLVILDENNFTVDDDLVEGLLLASWFHDTGMVEDSGEVHGAIGRKLCEKFLSSNRARKPALYGEILEAIEQHDAKDQSVYPDLVQGKPPAILWALSLADDADALGRVGVYRYTEIYLNRGVESKLLGIKVLANLDRRYRNITKSCAAIPALPGAFRPGYDYIVQFFNLYNQQMLVEDEAEKVKWGQLGAVNLIRKYSIEFNIRPENFRDQPEAERCGKTVKTFLEELQNEL